MKICVLLLLISHFTLSDILINDVNAVVHLESDHYMVLYGGDEHQVFIYDAVNDEMVRHVLQTGRGGWCRSRRVKSTRYVQSQATHL